MTKINVVDEKQIAINKSAILVLDNNLVNLNYNFKNGTYSLLIFCNHDNNIVINESGSLANATLRISYLELDNHDLIHNNHIDVYENSNLEINFVCLASKDKRISFDLVNNSIKSNININTNVVCIKDCHFELKCLGTIKKGAKKSTCHQNNHCLTINENCFSKVLPVLNIDENDVQASHSLSEGTISEEMMYYINSRGLNKLEALNLIVKSYLIPNDDFYLEFNDEYHLKQLAISKVDNVCLM